MLRSKGRDVVITGSYHHYRFKNRYIVLKMNKGYSLAARSVASKSGFPALTNPPKIYKDKCKVSSLIVERTRKENTIIAIENIK
jgi:hypothetical protein